jgi:hypothetical protein
LPKLFPTTVIGVWPWTIGLLPIFEGNIEEIDNDLYLILKPEVVTRPNDTLMGDVIRKPCGTLHNIEDHDIQNVDCESLGDIRTLLECLNGAKFDPKIYICVDPETGCTSILTTEISAYDKIRGETEYEK